MPNVKIPLSKPIVDHGGPVTEIELREPTFDEFLLLGEPYEVARSPETGALFSIENTETIRDYARLLLVRPTTLEQLNGAGFDVARKVRAAVLGFFRDGDGGKAETSEITPTSSSSPETPTASASTPPAP